MIEWKKYDPNNAPETNKKFLVKHDGGITSADLKRGVDRLHWQSYNGNYLFGVSHYAEINLPQEE